MWTENKSIRLSRLCVIAFMVLLAAAAASAPWLVDRLIGFSRTQLVGRALRFYLTIYIGCVPAALLLGSLFGLLRRLERGEVFIARNVDALRHISWCCFAGAADCLVSTGYYYPWLFVAVAAAFMGLIVRVVKNVFSRAVALQDDADFTI